MVRHFAFGYLFLRYVLPVLFALFVLGAFVLLAPARVGC